MVVTENPECGIDNTFRRCSYVTGQTAETAAAIVRAAYIAQQVVQTIQVTVQNKAQLYKFRFNKKC